MVSSGNSKWELLYSLLILFFILDDYLTYFNRVSALYLQNCNIPYISHISQYPTVFPYPLHYLLFWVMIVGISMSWLYLIVYILWIFSMSVLFTLFSHTFFHKLPCLTFHVWYRDIHWELDILTGASTLEYIEFCSVISHWLLVSLHIKMWHYEIFSIYRSRLEWPLCRSYLGKVSIQSRGFPMTFSFICTIHVLNHCLS